MSKKYLFTLVVFLGLLAVGFVIFQKVFPQPNQALPNEAPEQALPESQSTIPGLQIEVLQEGQGAVAKTGDSVQVHYTGKLENGSVFDSSLAGNPFSFALGQNKVIQGWEKGVLGMKAGEKRRLTIAPELAYGEQGTPGGPIPPNATLIFEVELLKIDQ